MATMRRRLTPEDVDWISEMDAAKGSYFQRDPERPDNVFVKPRRRQPVEVRRAQQRLRTARWRSEMDRLKAPTVNEVGMALATALATTSWQDKLTALDYDLIRRALADLQARGFSIDEARCQSALDWDPGSASKRDPFERRVRTVALAPSELAGVAETARARVGV